MKYLKKVFVYIAMVLCFSLCIGNVSHAKTIIEYKETNYGRIVDGLRDVYEPYNSNVLRINSHGKLEVNLIDYTVSKAAKKKLSDKKKLPKKNYKSYAHVTFDSKGKKKVNAIYDIYRKSWDKYVYGNKVYGIKRQTTLVVHSKNGKVLKEITPDLSKYRKKGEKRRLFIEMAEITGKNKVRLFYVRSSGNIDGGIGYGGILEVNTNTEKIKRIVSTDTYVPQFYDGKYMYGYKISSEKISFFRTSLKTNKTESFTVDAITFDEEKYSESREDYAFYRGNIMCVSPDGNVYFGTFDSKKIERVGDLSNCKYFNENANWGFAMKSKNEFYLMYDPATEAHMDNDGIRQRFFIVKYQNK